MRTATMQGANGHAARGRASIVRENGRYFLDFDGNFAIEGATNTVDVYLSGNGERPTSSDLNVARLRERIGAQRYELPGPGDRYPNVLLWCVPFQIAIGVGELR